MESALDLFAMAAALGNEDNSKYDVNDDISIELEKLWKFDVIKPATEDVWSLSLESFKKRYEEQVQPVVLQNCTKEWKTETFTIKNLSKRFGSEEFSLFGGQKFALSDYIKYCENRAEIDESPLYLFDDLSTLSSESTKIQLLEAYEVPHLFSAKRDCFEKVPAATKRPPFRWMLIGPAFSGTKIHVDPYGTSAWNTLLEGNKRWVLISPEISKSDIEEFSNKSCISVRRWFKDVLAPLKSFVQQKEKTQRRSLFYDFIQKCGDTVFVPFGWHHIVINLNNTVCVTQNYASEVNFSAVEAFFSDETTRSRFPDLVESILPASRQSCNKQQEE